MAKNEEVEDFSILLSTMSPNTNKSFKKTRNKKGKLQQSNISLT